MHISTAVVVFGFAASAIANTTTCNADNCLRAIRASAFPTRPGTADCSSYFRTTVTPATYTSTVTPTVTVFNNKRRRDNMQRDANQVPTLQARQVTVAPSSIPTYASACSGSVRYSSACSCIGVTATTTTAPTPTTTVTATATATVIDTHPSIAFEGYGSGDCSSFPEGPGSFIAGECTSLPIQISLEDDAINPGTCADTSSCHINLFPNNAGCDPAQIIRSVSAGPGCIYVGDAFYGQLVCPGC